MTKFYAKKKGLMIVERLEIQTQIHNKFSSTGVVLGQQGDFLVYNETDPDHRWIVDNNYVDEHYEIVGQVEADGLQEPPTLDPPEPPKPAPHVEEPELPPEDAPTEPEPTTDPEDLAR